MIELEFKLDLKKFSQKISIPKVAVGIHRNGPLYKWNKQLVPLVNEFGGRFKVNRQTPRPCGKSLTVGESFASVLEGTPLDEDFVPKEINKTANDIFVAFLRSNQESKDIKRLENSSAGIVKRAYFAMAKKLKNSAHRILRKGHTLYAIGTGQTLKTITGKMDKRKNEYF